MKLPVPALFLAALASGQWTPNVPLETRSIDEIYNAAKAEAGNLTILWGGDASSQGNAVAERWRQRFPDVPINLTTALSKYSASNIDRSFYEKNEYVDVAVLQTLQEFVNWDDQNRLFPYKTINWTLIDPAARDINGAWTSTNIGTFGRFIYDETVLNANDIPASYAEVLDPKWKGRLVLTYPNDDDAVGYLFSTIIKKYGFNWLDALAHQDVKWVRGTATPGFNIDPSTRNATDANRVLSFTSYPAGNQSGTILPRDDFYMTWYQRAAIFASTKQPESAKLFLNWLLSEEYVTQYQASLGVATIYPYINLPAGLNMTYGSNLTDTSGFTNFMGNKALVEWWRAQYELTLGFPVGADPNRIF